MGEVRDKLLSALRDPATSAVATIVAAAAAVIGIGVLAWSDHKALAVLLFAVAALFLVLPVLAFISIVRAWLREWRLRVAVIRRGQVAIDHADAAPNTSAQVEKGFLDFIVDAKRSQRAFVDVAEEIANNIAGITSTLQRRTKQITDAGKNVEKVHGIAQRVAKDMDRHSDFIEAHLRSLQEAASAFTDSYFRYVEWFAPKTEIDRQRLVDFGSTMEGLLEGAKFGRKGISDYRTGVARLRRLNVSQDINRATERLVPALDGIIRTIEEIEGFCNRLLRLINKKLAA